LYRRSHQENQKNSNGRQGIGSAAKKRIPQNQLRLETNIEAVASGEFLREDGMLEEVQAVGAQASGGFESV
jgi:hypothetical protein